jgi:purine-nucleoside phosphorylase
MTDERRRRNPSSIPWGTSVQRQAPDKLGQSDLSGELVSAVGAIRAVAGDVVPSVGLILGSGLGGFAERLEDKAIISYGDIPGFASSTVPGHAGRLVIGRRGGVACAVMQGRIHFYEGHSARQVAFPARTLVALGAETLIVTNAAGGLRHPPGTLMLIRDHINLFPDHPLRGPNDERIGLRFPDMTRAYPKELRALAREEAAALDLQLAEGVYAGSSGPSYETPAEIKMLEVLGADATGMSTVPEVIAAVHMGARVLGISCITNWAAGLGPGRPLSHDEVTETAEQVREKFEELLDRVVARLGPRETRR